MQYQDPRQPVDVRFHRQALGSELAARRSVCTFVCRHAAVVHRDRAARVVASVVRLAVGGSLVKMRASRNPASGWRAIWLLVAHFDASTICCSMGFRAPKSSAPTSIDAIALSSNETNLPPRSACIRFA